MNRISNDIRLEVDLQNNLIIFTGKKEKNYFDYDKDLFQILRTQCGSPYAQLRRQKDSRTKIKPYGQTKGLYLYDIAYACYHGYAHCQTFADDMVKFLKMKQDCGLTIDHLDGDYHNNTQANLALMTGELNRHKSNRTRKFLLPYKLTVAYVDGNYRLLLTAGDRVLEAKVLQDAESFVGALCGLLGTCYPDTGLPTPQDYYSRYKGDQTLTRDTKQSVLAQRKIAEMPLGEFVKSSQNA